MSRNIKMSKDPDQFFGWGGYKGAEEAFEVMQGNFIPFVITGKQVPPKQPIWEYAKQLNGGKHLTTWFQKSGDCVSMGVAQALDYMYCSQIVRGRTQEELHRAFPPYIYGVSRTARDIGNGKLRGKGSFGSWGIAAVMKYGTLYMDDDGVPAYSGRVADSWGSSGVPKQYYEIAADNLVKASSRLTTVDQIREALRNHYPITIASDRAFSTKTINGNVCYVHNPYDRWPHQMCLKIGSKIITKDGMKLVEDIAVGDIVQTHMGELRPVSKLFVRSYDGDLCRIRTIGGMTLSVTPEHPVLAFRSRSHGRVNFAPGIDFRTSSYHVPKNVADIWASTEPEWIPACELDKDDFLLAPLPSWLHNGRPKYTGELPQTKDVAWFLGLYAADGSAKKDHKVFVTLHESSARTIDRACEAIRQLGFEPHVSKVKNKRAVRVTLYSARLARAFKNWFGLSVERVIPDFIYASGWDLEAFMQGHFDGDGTYAKSGAEKHGTVSEQMFWQLRMIALYLGKRVFFEKTLWSGAPETWRPVWWLRWKDDAKHSQCRRWRNYNCYRIMSVESEYYNGNVYNFEVEDHNSYQVEGLAVHNCGISWKEEGNFAGMFRLNSWGPGSTPKPLNGEPLGGAYQLAEDLEKELKTGVEVYAISAVNGFPAANYALL